MPSDPSDAAFTARNPMNTALSPPVGSSSGNSKSTERLLPAWSRANGSTTGKLPGRGGGADVSARGLSAHAVMTSSPVVAAMPARNVRNTFVERWRRAPAGWLQAPDGCVRDTGKLHMPSGRAPMRASRSPESMNVPRSTQYGLVRMLRRGHAGLGCADPGHVPLPSGRLQPLAGRRATRRNAGTATANGDCGSSPATQAGARSCGRSYCCRRHSARQR